jgi:Xaa-Pro aminopeptidase
MTERELATRIALGIVKRGAEVLYVQAGTGAAAAGRYLPTDRKINRGDIIRTDVCAVVEGYHSDLGRCYVVGEPTPEQERTYGTAYRALQAGLAALKPGARAREVFDSALAVWHQSGFEQVRRHHVGHGLGLEPHEPPVLRPDNETLIEPGMVIAVEVPYYVYGFGGFAPEDVVVVEDGGNIQFSHAPAELRSVG